MRFSTPSHLLPPLSTGRFTLRPHLRPAFSPGAAQVRPILRKLQVASQRPLPADEANRGTCVIFELLFWDDEATDSV